MKKKSNISICFMSLMIAGLILMGCSDGQPVIDTHDVEGLLIIQSAAQFDDEVLKAEKPVLVDFWATWCPPCRKMNPVVAEAAGRYHEALDVAKIDLDDNKQLAERFSIRAVPTFMIFYDGKVVAAHEGFMRASSFSKWIEEQLNKLGVEVPPTTT